MALPPVDTPARGHSDPPVLIAGAGPVGMTLALDLAERGIDVLVLEQSLVATDNPRCNTTNARSMEYFRRLGIADEIRRAGLPLEHPSDVVYCTNLIGWELARFRFSSSGEILDGTAAEFAEWATPEPQHRVSQIFLEPILESALRAHPRVTLRRGLRVTRAEQIGHAVHVEADNVVTGGVESFTADYLVGCDGSNSVVRKTIGAVLEGDSRVAERRVSVYFRSEELHALLGPRPGWMYWWYGPIWRGSFVQLDGRSLYLCHSRVPVGMDPQDVDPDEVLEAAVGKPVEHEKLQVVRWDPRRLVADRFREDRILLAGDAAHLWLPIGGFGMNTGIADAMGLSWRLAANVQGWGGDRLFDDYQLERRSVGEATSRAALKLDSDMTTIGRDPELHADSDRGEELRRTAGQLIELTDKKQWHSQGVQFGARYLDSEGIRAGDDDDPQTDAIGGIDIYEPSVSAGSRLPHFWRPDGSSVFDALGPGWTIITVGPEPPSVDSLLAAARERSAPLSVLHLPEAEAMQTYSRPLLLCRPDLFVAWSGAEPPADAGLLLDGLLGCSPG